MYLMMQNKCNEPTCLSLSARGKSNMVFLEKSNVLTKKKYSKILRVSSAMH